MLIPSDTCMDTVSIIAPAMAFPINMNTTGINDPIRQYSLCIGIVGLGPWLFLEVWLL